MPENVIAEPAKVLSLADEDEEAKVAAASGKVGYDARNVAVDPGLQNLKNLLPGRVSTEPGKGAVKCRRR